MVRAKFRVLNITLHDAGGKTVEMYPVYSSDPNSENKSFSDETPSGNIKLCISKGRPASDLFEPGKEYYVDFTPAELPAILT
jgi:hypothetical protein